MSAIDVAPPAAVPSAPDEHGLPHDRRTRLAARRAFVNLKQTYLLALDGQSGARADWLRHQVRQAEDPTDLWLLRRLVLDSMPASAQRTLLQRGLQQLFPPRRTQQAHPSA